VGVCVYTVHIIVVYLTCFTAASAAAVFALAHTADSPLYRRPGGDGQIVESHFDLNPDLNECFDSV